MSYTNGTTHYNLPQTLGTDKRDWFDTNQAFADIDAAIYGAVQNASQAVTDLSALTTRVGTAENDIDTLETSIGTHTSQISAMQTSITQIGNAVTDNKQDVLDMIESTQEASATATYAHAVGSYFIYNDTLYVTTVAIAVGDTIVPNTNCETTDIGTVLTRLSSDLTNDETTLTQLYNELHKGSIEVTADGVKTNSQLLDELYALVDTSKVSKDTALYYGEHTIYHIMADSPLMFSNGYIDATNGETITVLTVSSTGSSMYIGRSGARVDNSSAVPANEYKITLVY